MMNGLIDEGRELIDAAEEGDVAGASVLIAAGADVEETDTGGWTPLMVAAQAGGGCVVHLLDCRIARADGGAFAQYAATKRELADSVARLAREWAPRTRVNGVAPGPVRIPEGVREAAGDLPLGRRPTEEDVARAVAFLCESDAITGQILYVDGGQHLAEG